MKQSITKKSPATRKTLAEKIVISLVMYVKTQLLLVAIIALASWVVLSILNIRFALLLAIFTGAISIVPVFGITVAAVIVGIVAIFDGARFLPGLPKIAEGLAILLIYGLLNIAIDYFLSPYLTGKITKIHPLLLLLAVIMGTAVFGIPGALLAAPMLLVTKTILDHYNEHAHTR